MKLWVNGRTSNVHHLESYSTASLDLPMAFRHGSSREKAGHHSKLWISSGYLGTHNDSGSFARGHL